MIGGAHEMHLVQPERYFEELTRFVDDLRIRNKLPYDLRQVSLEQAP